VTVIGPAGDTIARVRTVRISDEARANGQTYQWTIPVKTVGRGVKRTMSGSSGSSGATGRRADRAARLAARDAETVRARRRRWLVRAAIVAVLALGVVWGGLALYRRATEPATWQTFPDQGNVHLAGPDSVWEGYNSDPPTSGPHAPQRPRWGIHTTPIPKVFQVHGLEDGGVLVQYSCPAGCPELVAKLAEVVGRYREQVILAPYPGMRHRIALTAWTTLDAFDELDEARIVRFIERFRGIDHHK
jgi:Protein of unknown function (DUF3105)